MKTNDPRPSARSDSLEELFDNARDDGFSRGETSELWKRVGAFSPGTSGTHGDAASPGSSGMMAAGASVKTIAALLIGGGLVVAGGLAHRWPSPDRARTASVSAPAPVPVPAPAVAASVVGPRDPLPPVVDVRDLPSVSGPARAAPTSRGLAGAEKREMGQAVQTPLVPARSAAFAESGETSNPALERATALSASLSAPPLPGHEPQADDQPAVAQAFDPGPSEGALLLRARRVVTSDPASALALAQEHARRFPAGALVPEREVLAIEALARLGRTAEASQRLASFQTQFPQSPHIARLAALIAAQP